MTALATSISVTVAAIVLVAATVVLVMRRVHRPTTGTPIDRSDRAAHALLVVDMQTDFVDGNGYSPNEVERKIRRLNALAEESRAAGRPTATLRQVYRGPVATTVIRLLGRGLGNPSSSGLGLHADVGLEAGADFVKSRLDGFSNPALGRWLEQHDVRTVEIAGLDGCYCVRATAIGALNRGFDVVLHDDAILATDVARWRGLQEKLLARGARIDAG
ncbi:MAG: isochorismatase family cysteine hydrolase [Actinomycetota bacterium]